VRHALTQALGLLAVAAIAAAPASAKAPPIEWTMPDRLGPDLNDDGLIDYADSAASVAAGPFTVVLEVRPDLCRKLSTYRWSVEGQLVGGGRADCRFEQRFAAEGTYEVAVEVEDPAGNEETYGRPVVVEDWLVVSIGDSVASGEGNPDRPGLVRPARWQSPRCHRSTRAAPVGAARTLELADRRTSTTFVHLACSGAALEAGLLEGYEGADVPAGANPRLLPPQVDELEAIASQRPIDAVLINIGANDLHFSALVKFCLRFGDCISKSFDPHRPFRELESGEGQGLPVVIAGALERLRGGYRALGERLARVVDPSRVLIVDYFDPTRDRDGTTCRKIGIPFVPGFYIARAEAAWAYTNLLAPLNREIAAAADREGWVEVTGVAEAFSRHGYCAGDEAWVRTLARSLFTQAGANPGSRAIGTLHPNEDGHRQTAALLGAALRRTLYPLDGPLESPPQEVTGIVPPADGEASGAGERKGGDFEWPAALGVLAALGLGATVPFAVKRARGRP
jgi:GDSL-like Lipase/Acylhydrolase family